MDVIEPHALPLKVAPELNRGTIHLWWLNLDRLGLPPGLDPRGKRGLRMQQRFLLRLLLGAYLRCPGRDVRVLRNAAGRPRLAPPHDGSGLQFNLSHAGPRLVVAIARGAQPGVDIESASRPVNAHRLANRWFGADEALAIARLDAAAAQADFLRRWTVREALIKAAGGRIATDLAAIALEVADPTRIERLPADWPAVQHWQVAALAHPDGWIGHLACARRFDGVREFELGPPTAQALAEPGIRGQ